MRVLLTGTEGSGIDQVERRLRAQGHEVLSCRAGSDPATPCVRTIDRSRCPAQAGVDVIVAARQRPLPHLTSQEQLIECELLTSVPLVVAGSTVVNPFGARADVLVEGFDNVIDACRSAVQRSRHGPIMLTTGRVDAGQTVS